MFLFIDDNDCGMNPFSLFAFRYSVSEHHIFIEIEYTTHQNFIIECRYIFLKWSHYSIKKKGCEGSQY